MASWLGCRLRNTARRSLVSACSSVLLALSLTIIPTGVFRTASANAKAALIRSTMVDWPKVHFDQGNTAFNPVEKTIGPANVADLAEAWHRHAGVVSGIILHGGIIYTVGHTSGPVSTVVYAVNAKSGRTLWRH